MFGKLPADIQERAKKAFQVFVESPTHPALNLHPLSDTRGNPSGSRSVSISIHYRAVYFIDDEGFNVWYWIGSHSDYDKQFGKNR